MTRPSSTSSSAMCMWAVWADAGISSHSRFARWSSGTALPVFPMRVARRILWTLYLGNLFTSIGLWFFLPLLPIFIGRRGGSAALVGAVFDAGLLASAAIRYHAGWAADR